jgi:uncharacterized protein YybS (DUF2232 family)
MINFHRYSNMKANIFIFLNFRIVLCSEIWRGFLLFFSINEAFYQLKKIIMYNDGIDRCKIFFNFFKFFNFMSSILCVIHVTH